MGETDFNQILVTDVNMMLKNHSNTELSMLPMTL